MIGFKPLMSPEAYRIVMHNARSLARGDHKRKPNWSFAMQMFSCGSTYGYMHCEHAEIDPDAVTVGEIWRSRQDDPSPQPRASSPADKAEIERLREALGELVEDLRERAVTLPNGTKQVAVSDGVYHRALAALKGGDA